MLGREDTPHAATFQAVMEDAVSRMERLGMEVARQQVEPCTETHTVLGHARDYEGGFVLLRITRAAAVMHQHGVEAEHASGSDAN